MIWQFEVGITAVNQQFPDVMKYWPEKETAVAIRKINADEYECISAFGFESLFNLHITYNPKRELSVFENRVQAKNWQAEWPALAVYKKKHISYHVHWNRLKMIEIQS